MPTKKYKVIFNSKKTQHPLGEVSHEYFVATSTKGFAQAIAKERLAEDDPDNVALYKAPQTTKVDELPTEKSVVEEFAEAPDAPLTPDEIEDAEYMQADMDEELNERVQIEDPIIEPDSIPQQELEPEPEPEAELMPENEATEVAEKIIFKNGTYDMPNHVYHQSEGISSSMIKKACESMMLYQKLYVTKEIEPSKGDALRLGNLFHTLVLEPLKLEEEYVLIDSTIDRRTKAGREAYSIVLEHAEQKHMYVINESELELAQAMADVAVNDKYATKLLRSPTRRTEVSYFATHPTTGLQVKVRPDLSVGDVCIDLKSIHVNRSVDSEWMLEHLRREVIKYKYHLSAAMYLEVAKLKDFVWIFVNKAPGYHWVAVVKAGEELLAEGEELYHTAMHRIHNAMKEDEWPGPMSVIPTVHNNKIILPEI